MDLWDSVIDTAWDATFMKVNTGKWSTLTNSYLWLHHCVVRMAGPARAGTWSSALHLSGGTTPMTSSTITGRNNTQPERRGLRGIFQFGEFVSGDGRRGAEHRRRQRRDLG